VTVAALVSLSAPLSFSCPHEVVQTILGKHLAQQLYWVASETALASCLR
jgi:hypothetical protein